MGKKDNQSIFHNGFWRKPKPVHLCPIHQRTTRANQHHPPDLSQVTAAQTEDLGQQGKALKQSIKCRGFLLMRSVITCSGCICPSSLQGNCSASWLRLSHTLSQPFPLWMALPWKLLLWRGPVVRPWSQTAKLHPHLELQLPPSANTAPWEGQGPQHSWGWQKQLCAHHIALPSQRDKDKLAKAQWEGSPAPLSCFLAAPRDLFPISSSHCVIFPGFNSDIPSDSPVKPLHTPTAFLALSHTPGITFHPFQQLISLSPHQPGSRLFLRPNSWNSYREQLLT